MSAEISPSTRVLALLGDPVSHSLSPTFQNVAIRSLGLDGVYVAIRCAADDLAGLIRGIGRAGGGGNITVPHKSVATAVVERATEAVARTGACNTFWCEGGRICGDNTDVEGVAAAVRSILGSSPRGARVLLLGAGGAASATIHALVRDGASEIVLLNRSPDRARDLVDRFRNAQTRLSALHDPPGASRLPNFDLVINATSLGLRDDDPLPIEPAQVGATAALDLVYRPGETAWVRTMRESGLPAADGLEMLIQQGAAAFRRWWGEDPPIEHMRDAIARL